MSSGNDLIRSIPSAAFDSRFPAGKEKVAGASDIDAQTQDLARPPGVLRRPRMPLLIHVTSAFCIRSALRRSPPRMTILAPILTREHAYDDEEADDRHQSDHDEGGC